MTPIRQPIRAFNAWLNEPVANTAGRFGLFRILYGLFYLWYIATQRPAMIALLPESFYEYPIWLLAGWPMPPSVTQIETIESLLAGALVMLTVGYRTRLMTALVLLLGCVLEGYVSVVDIERSNVLLVFFLPFFMLLVGDWHSCYSLDSLRRRSRSAPRDQASLDPHARSSSFKAAKLSLIVFVVMFLSAGVYKLTGSWLEQPAFVGHAMLATAIDAAFFDLWVNPLGYVAADTPWLYRPMMWSAIALECLFFVCLFGRRLRVIVFTIALLFHSANAFLMWVTFTGIMITYAAFMDWQSLADRWGVARFTPVIRRIPPGALTGAAVIAAVATGLGWNTTPIPRGTFTLGGLVTFQTIWLPIPFIAIFWCVSALTLKRERDAW